MNKDIEDFLYRNFGVEVKDSQSEVVNQYEFFKKLLAGRIKYFIRHDLDKLLQALYRIDVKDKDSDEAFSLGDIDKISNKLSDLIITRQIKKIEYSKKFKGDL